ncbi:Os01g0732801 [Oryza sativa Japonica Group]|uniref:Os01g0732801 protein n=2 Tax=Oryza sativa subsp. japonica TaxID=39947 RepID=C7IXW3_ORYSJ|nr:Os01g0732801 [Oryza sativa Japonica Group]BAS74201.1 Os01g0732801 [Oryza sativa Japonica Group]|eukprot:NP_001172555.1 Os01g0732801 [Oryza sativa Japonica Group]
MREGRGEREEGRGSRAAGEDGADRRRRLPTRSHSSPDPAAYQGRADFLERTKAEGGRGRRGGRMPLAAREDAVPTELLRRRRPSEPSMLIVGWEMRGPGEGREGERRCGFGRQR